MLPGPSPYWAFTSLDILQLFTKSRVFDLSGLLIFMFSSSLTFTLTFNSLSKFILLLIFQLLELDASFTFCLPCFITKTFRAAGSV